jgi:predicted Zn-dependent peptidase
LCLDIGGRERSTLWSPGLKTGGFHMNRKAKLFVSLLLLLFAVSWSQTLEVIKNRIQTHTLANGMKFIVLERPEAPVVSFHTYADVGSSQEVQGITGISHILEHMAFKGTTSVGVKDLAVESKLLAEMDNVYDQLSRAERAAVADSAKIKILQTDFEKLKKAGQGQVVVNEYMDLLRKQGSSGLNAFTSNDATQYVVSLPSNKLEFWMAAESDRFLNPVFRQYFEERNVIIEERRLTLETQPTGKLLEDFIATAFKSHPYHHSVIGHMSDIQRISRQDVIEYFKKFYNPSNLTCAIVGDVKAAEVFRFADLYFGRIPSGPKPEPLRTEEPEQWGERLVQVQVQAQPIMIMGYHRPSVRSHEDVAFDAMANIFGTGRSSRIYKALVKEKKLAIQTGAMNGFPGDKYPNLFAVFAVPAQERTSKECQEAIDAEIEKFKNEPITTDELNKFKRQSKKGIINQMKSNGQMAMLLTYYDVVLGDWKMLFDSLPKIEAITAADIQNVAKKYLVPKNRTIGELVTEKL